MTTNRVVLWLGGASIDAAGRMLVQLVVTAVLARMLSPESFGVAAIVLATIGSLTTFAGGAPFEEPLVNKSRLRRRHLEAALAASLLTATLCTLLVWLTADLIAGAFDSEVMSSLLLASCSILFANALLTILTALARRRRQFRAIAQASLFSHILGGAAAIVMGLMGAGVWALVGFRIVVMIANALFLNAFLGYFLKPIWDMPRLRELLGFASISSAERFSENANYLLFNYVVGAFFGLGTVGQLNMAMRIVEPLRGAFMSISHNLAYPRLLRGARTGDGLKDGVLDVTLANTLIAIPLFLGVATVSAALIQTIAGPGWEPAAGIAAMLAFGAAIMATDRGVYTATQVVGRPDLNLVRRIVGIIAMMVVLVAGAGFGPMISGIARVAGDFAESLWTTSFSRSVARTPLPALAAVAISPWISALTMEVAVALVTHSVLGFAPAVVALIIGVITGVLVYVGMLALVARTTLCIAIDWVRPAPIGAS